MDVISFYPYSAIESLLHTKHKAEGYRIYKKLAKMTMKPFVKEFAESLESDVYILGVDEYVGSGYSHTALLTRELGTKYTKIMHGKLLAQNRISYSGKDLQFRLNNRRNFNYTGKKDIDVILVDDTITTGITLQEAQNVLLQHGVNVLFALTLADAKE
ncbi:ComF family protein [Sulfurovum mangrovi]|uniref:ComF family protein n=1 Tax=Sulfurovum mangrovi TaxID=2893889 RepID=UPI001E3C37C2|nr:ComF family protein [Sulfurovum mangrovi]UFH60417.1 ComF family protein [Sulfurovum mangrovi]